MCQISVCNLGDERLNKLMFLLMGTYGSTVHNDGWGFSEGNGSGLKSSNALYYTSDSGKVLGKSKGNDKSPFLGHIRRASVKVPVCMNNSHPFWDKNTGIVFVHNGTLTPKNEKDFILEEEADDIDPKTHKPVLDSKTGLVKKVKVGRSDSLVFFEEFLKHYKNEAGFVNALKETMELFTGKFAFVFIINGSFYIVRGKTADLHISYLTKDYSKDSPVIGWAINTDEKVLDYCSILLSNLQQFDGKKPMCFTFPQKLKEETIYKAARDGLEILGEIKENETPKPAYTYFKGNDGASNFTSYGGKNTGVTKPTELQKLYKQIVEFMLSFSLSPMDIQAMFEINYGASTLEVDGRILKHFCTSVIPAATGRVDKKIRKRLKKALGGTYLRRWQYEPGLKYPWFLSSRKEQLAFVEYLEAKERKQAS